MKCSKDINIRNIVIISIVYFAAHWFLLVATGTWGDDWAYADKDWTYLYEAMRQSSVPLDAYLAASTWLFPDGFNRVLVFGWYYLIALLFYFIVRKMECIGENASLWIGCLFCIIPVNDARIQWINYNYAVGFAFFLLGIYIAVINLDRKSKKYRVLRLLSLLALFVGYSFLQSTMVYAILLVCYLGYVELKNEWKWGEIGANLKKLSGVVIRNMDYLLEPVLWYIGDKLLFPGYGGYEGVYSVKWGSVLGILVNSPYCFYKTIRRMLSSFDKTLSISAVTPVLLIIGIAGYYTYLFANRAKKNSTSSMDKEKKRISFIMIIVGAIISFFGYFPYVVKIGSAIVLENDYTAGRHTILLGMGVAIILYYAVDIIFRDHISQAIFISVIAMGIVHFNCVYMDWQEAYYQEQQIEHEIVQNDRILSNNTFLVVLNNEVHHSVYPFRFNGASWAATGDKKRIYLIGASELERLRDLNDDTWYRSAFITDYEYDDGSLDGIIFADFTRIDRGDIFRQKFNELFDYSEYSSWIDKTKSIQFVPLTKSESDGLVDLLYEGKLDDELIVDMYKPKEF